jgi:protein-tyrosine phosphatase
MIDLHAHILPAVDDGAQTLDEAARMCRLAAEDGCEILIATPHQRHELWENAEPGVLEGSLLRLQASVGQRPRLLLGAEVHVDSELLPELVPFSSGSVLSLADSRYLLLEFDREDSVVDPEWLIHELAVCGWFPILAHPEFIPWLAEDLALVERLVERGALVQITAMSLTGEFGRPLADWTHQLMAAGIAHFVASDCHGPRWRPPGLRRAYETVARSWDDETAWRLFSENPQAVIEDRPLPAAA